MYHLPGSQQLAVGFSRPALGPAPELGHCPTPPAYCSRLQQGNGADPKQVTPGPSERSPCLLDLGLWVAWGTGPHLLGTAGDPSRWAQEQGWGGAGGTGAERPGSRGGPTAHWLWEGQVHPTLTSHPSSVDKWELLSRTNGMRVNVKKGLGKVGCGRSPQGTHFNLEQIQCPGEWSQAHSCFSMATRSLCWERPAGGTRGKQTGGWEGTRLPQGRLLAGTQPGRRAFHAPNLLPRPRLSLSSQCPPAMGPTSPGPSFLSST